MTLVPTFRQLDGNGDLGDSALDDWYGGIRDTPINQLNDGDLATACRQQLYTDYVVPVVIERLQLQPLAGDTYDGELLVALKSINMTYWRNHEAEAHRVLTLVSQVTDGDLQDDIAGLKEKLDLAVT